MKHSLRTRIMLGMPAIFIIVMLAVTVVIIAIHGKENRKETELLLGNAFGIIRYTVLEKENNLINNFKQTASLNDMGGMLKYITDNKSFFKYSIMKPTYIKLTDVIQSTNVLANIYRTCIYDINGDLTAFSINRGELSVIGYVHNQETIETTSTESNGELTNEFWQQQNSLPTGVEMHFGREIYNKETLDFKTIDNILCVVAYIPIIGKDYNTVTEKMEPKQTGLAVTVQKLDAAFTQKISELTGTNINIHTNGTASFEKLADYYETVAQSENKQYGWTLDKQPITFNDIVIKGQSYYSAALPVYSDSKRIAAIEALYSKKRFHAYTSELIKLLSIIYLIGLIIIVPVTITFVIREIINPIKKVAGMMRQIEDEQDFESKISIKRKDEIGDLAASFNGMITNLQKTTTSIENLNYEIAERKKAQERLHQSEENYRMQFEEAMDAIFAGDLETGVITYCNNAAAKLVEREKSELIGQSQRILYPPGKFNGHLSDVFMRNLNEKTEQIMETQVITKSGVIKDVAIKPSLLQIGDKKILQGIFRDITENKKAEEALRRSETKFRTLYDTTSDAVMLLADGKFFDCNKAALRIYGCADLKDLCSKHPTDLSPPKQPCGEDSITLANKQIAIAMENGSNHFEWVHKRADTGKEFIADVLINTMELDGKKVIHTVVRDITERKQAEESTKKLNDNLEEVNQELKNFVYIASHDLREPLRKITSFGQLLRKSLDNKLSGDDIENFNFMIDGATRMSKMIEGLLVYSRVSTQVKPTKNVDLNELVKQLQHFELSVILEEKHVVVDIPQPLPSIMVDPVQILQLMQNLIANGIKYQKKDNPPRITITSKPAANGMVRIEVTDNGIGIAPEFQNAIFTMFKRLHTRDEYEGTGIGLAVCKKIVERHGGQIGIESEPEKGSTFWFTVAAAENLVSVSAS